MTSSVSISAVSSLFLHATPSRALNASLTSLHSIDLPLRWLASRRRYPSLGAARRRQEWWSRVLGTAMIVALVGGGWIAGLALAFHAPSSAVEALLPRL